MRPKLSFANVVSVLALFVALGGSAYAFHLGKNSVGSKQLKKNAVVTAKVKNEAITGAKVKKGTLTGTQINSSTIGRVPEASYALSADHAREADHAGNSDTANMATSVNGASVVKFERNGAVSPLSPITILSLAGLQLEYACTTGFPDSISFHARTSVDGANLTLARTFAGGATVEEMEPFNTGVVFLLVGFAGTGVYTAPGGKVVTFTYRNPGVSCKTGVAGTAYGG